MWGLEKRSETTKYDEKIRIESHCRPRHICCFVNRFSLSRSMDERPSLCKLVDNESFQLQCDSLLLQDGLQSAREMLQITLKRQNQSEAQQQPITAQLSPGTQSDVTNNDVTRKNTQDSNSFTCGVCDEVFKEEEHLERHFKQHSVPQSLIEYSQETTVETSFGEIVFPSYQAYGPKITVKEPTEPKQYHPCSICAQVFTSHNGLSNHMLIHVEKKPAETETTAPSSGKYKCRGCTKTFNQRSELTRHMYLHPALAENAEEETAREKKRKTQSTSSSPSPSPVEDSEPSSGGAENDSITVDVLGYHCDLCNKSYKRKSSYVMHTKAHASENGNRCAQCGKNFFDRNNLIKHQQTHSRDRPYTCEVCHKAFTQKPVLVEHRRIHTGEKPFQCNECGKAFTAKVNLSKHRRIHTGEKPFECEQCGKAFTQKSSLWTHRRTHGVTKN